MSRWERRNQTQVDSIQPDIGDGYKPPGHAKTCETLRERPGRGMAIFELLDLGISEMPDRGSRRAERGLRRVRALKITRCKRLQEMEDVREPGELVATQPRQEAAVADGRDRLSSEG